jgi:hypothetical protein
MDGGGPGQIVNSVTGDVSGHLVQAGSITGGVHFHLAARRSVSSRSRAAQSPSWLARLSDGAVGVLLDSRQVLVLGSSRLEHVLVDLPL